MIIVTGANGFVGQQLVPQLVKKYPTEKIFCCVGKIKKKHERIGLDLLRRLKVEIIQIDLLNKKTLSKLPKSPRVIVHLAASVDTANEDFGANDQGTMNLINSLDKIQNSHLIFTSTAAVWSGRKNCDKPISSSDPVQPNNSYGRTKVLAEKYLQQNATIKGYLLTILRLNTVYGPDIRRDKLFGVLRNYIEKKSILARINWPGRLGLVHVDDVVMMIIDSIKHPPKKSKVKIEIVSSENITLSKISQGMYQALGKKYRPVILPDSIWKILKNVKYFLALSEIVLPSSLFNLIWRFSLIADNVLEAKVSPEIKLKLKKRKLFSQNVKDVLVNLDS